MFSSKLQWLKTGNDVDHAQQSCGISSQTARKSSSLNKADTHSPLFMLQLVSCITGDSKDVP